MRFLLGMCNHLQRAAVYLGRYTAVSFSAHILSRGAVVVYWQWESDVFCFSFGHLLSGSTMRIAACGGFLFAPQDGFLFARCFDRQGRYAILLLPTLVYCLETTAYVAICSGLTVVWCSPHAAVFFLLPMANKLRRTDPDTGWHTMLLLMLIYSLLFLADIEKGYQDQAGQAEFPYGVGR